MKSKLYLVVLFLLCASRVSAQTTYANCTNIQGWLADEQYTWNSIGGYQYISAGTKGYDVSCRTTGETSNHPPNTVYWGPFLNSVSGTGSATQSGNGNIVLCNPQFSTYAYVAPTAGNTNYWRNTVHNEVANPGAPPGSIIASGYCTSPSSVVHYSYCQSIACGSQNHSSPIVIDVSGKGFFLTSSKDGVMFDIEGTGKPIQIAWTAKGADNAFLALPDLDGKVTSGRQLFGDHTPQPPSDHPNGFDALRVYDGNGDGIIDARDAVFNSLRLWRDDNHDGIAQPEELHTLGELGVNSISLKYKEEKQQDPYGNLFRYRARLNPDKPTGDGKFLYDIFLVTCP